MSNDRNSPIGISKEDFKKMGYQLVDAVAGFIDTIQERPVTTGESPKALQAILGNTPLPNKGTAPDALLTRATELLFDHSLLNGHPRFMGYITSSAAPLGALADMLAAAVNPNAGAQILSPMATEIEKQTIRWLAELIGVSPDYGGVLVSGGNMANFTAFLAARIAKASKGIKEDGLTGANQKMTIYCSSATHTWIEKAAILFGHGSNAIRWILSDETNKMDLTILEETFKIDTRNGYKPFLVVGNAGDVSTGAVDDFKAMAALCKQYNVWFHIDGAYGIPAAVVPDLKAMFEGIEDADSIALDPHKWLYSPLEAGCTLVKDRNHLIEAYSSHPVYYNFSNTDDEIPPQNFYEYGLQNSRGFRALKVWLTLQQVGRSGYIQMISEDIALSKLLFDLADKHPELEAVTQNLSIATLRYMPAKYRSKDPEETYLNSLNEALLNDLQQQGEVFLSNAMVDGKYCLRSCIVNFRTAAKDIEAIVEIIVAAGRKLHTKLSEEQAVQ